MGLFVRGLLLAALTLCSVQGAGADTIKMNRPIKKEPAYRTKPRYCLLAFGTDAKTQIWLVLDGDVLYVDKNGDGDLTPAEERFTSTKEQNRSGDLYNVGDIAASGKIYTNVGIRIEKLKDRASTYDDWPAFQKSISADPGALTYQVWAEVPPHRPIKDVLGQPVARILQIAPGADLNGLLQFAERPSATPIIHFGGPWTIWLNERQKFVLGRPEQFIAHIGTPGQGPGTFAMIQYHAFDDRSTLFVPTGAKPVLDVLFPAKENGPVAAHFVLEDRC